ncbi:hypothetical protein KDL01_25025 [Actinospica durhamensis]|uniref:Diadenosine tetraphosphate (Ap4A) hydrolase n=1 Tax=Actinospica durhamensis TaxID=1508375 RepID=A0A941ESL6_9ACTN|nr:hypothetical protein [Actinospica durhamensis]MBR7836566.1 hypothetical protein [Actinospica durhamensis]
MSTDEPDPVVQPSEYVSDLPIGVELKPKVDHFTWDVFPFAKDDEGRVRIRRLDQPVLPEPPRNGEDGPRDCVICAKPDEKYLWTDEHWRVAYQDPEERRGSLATVFLEPRVHTDLGDLPAERALELGPMIVRVERALASLEGVGRVHVNRWGDGVAHLHLWFTARPAGMLQLRGTFLPLWNSLLPRVTTQYFDGVNMKLAAALEKDGGRAHVR